jgi:hypothetical protein
VSGNRARDGSHFGKEDGKARGVERYWQRRLRIRKLAAGRTLETACSTQDLERQSAVAHAMHEIDAITSARELDL